MKVTNDNETITESLGAEIGSMKMKLDNLSTLSKKWRSSRSAKAKNVVEIKNVPDKIFEEIKYQMNMMKTCGGGYMTYKIHFDRFCCLVGINPKGTIIVKYEFKKGDEPNKNSVKVQYSNNTKTILIPNGCSLYHVSTVPGITELEPQYRGKSAKGYLYDSPRIYFTIRKNMPKFLADYKAKDTNIHKYKCTENIRVAYVDPLVWAYHQGAVYIDTKYPVKVEEVGLPMKNIKENTNENPTFGSLEEFMEYYGLIEISEDEVYEESIKAMIGHKIRQMADDNAIKDSWEKLSKAYNKVFVEKDLPKQEADKIKEAHEITKKKVLTYSKYKKAFNEICKFAGANPEETVIEHVEFKNNSDGTVHVSCRYARGRKRIMIPNGTQLIHVSPDSKIKELKPTFRSKTVGCYLYSSRRVFFTLKKEVKPNKAGLEHTKTYRYTPKDKIQTAYIDPSISSYGAGSVYVETSFPIKVINVLKKGITNLFKEDTHDDVEKLTDKDIQDIKLSIYESEAAGDITSADREILLTKLYEYI